MSTVDLASYIERLGKGVKAIDSAAGREVTLTDTLLSIKQALVDVVMVLEEQRRAPMTWTIETPGHPTMTVRRLPPPRSVPRSLPGGGD